MNSTFTHTAGPHVLACHAMMDRQIDLSSYEHSMHDNRRLDLPRGYVKREGMRFRLAARWAHHLRVPVQCEAGSTTGILTQCRGPASASENSLAQHRERLVMPRHDPHCACEGAGSSQRPTQRRHLSGGKTGLPHTATYRDGLPESARAAAVAFRNASPGCMAAGRWLARLYQSARERPTFGGFQAAVRHVRLDLYEAR